MSHNIIAKCFVVGDIRIPFILSLRCRCQADFWLTTTQNQSAVIIPPKITWNTFDFIIISAKIDNKNSIKKDRMVFKPAFDSFVFFLLFLISIRSVWLCDETGFLTSKFLRSHFRYYTRQPQKKKISKLSLSSKTENKNIQTRTSYSAKKKKQNSRFRSLLLASFIFPLIWSEFKLSWKKWLFEWDFCSTSDMLWRIKLSVKLGKLLRPCAGNKINHIVADNIISHVSESSMWTKRQATCVLFYMNLMHSSADCWFILIQCMLLWFEQALNTIT